jgi:hypothetical protein
MIYLIRFCLKLYFLFVKIAMLNSLNVYFEGSFFIIIYRVFERDINVKE